MQYVILEHMLIQLIGYDIRGTAQLALKTTPPPPLPPGRATLWDQFGSTAGRSCWWTGRRAELTRVQKESLCSRTGVCTGRRFLIWQRRAMQTLGASQPFLFWGQRVEVFSVCIDSDTILACRVGSLQ